MALTKKRVFGPLSCPSSCLSGRHPGHHPGVILGDPQGNRFSAAAMYFFGVWSFCPAIVLGHHPGSQDDEAPKNKKIRIIDYSKVNENEKKLKNKMGIDKIKIVYFD